MKEYIKRVNRRLIHESKIFTHYEDEMLTIDGHVSHFQTIEHKGAAGIIPVLENGKILMVRQFRNPISDYVLEIPAGGRNSKEESTKECALRELEEETGYRADDAELLVTFGPALAYSSEILDIYVAEDLKKGEQNFDPDEYVELEEWDVDALIELIYKGELIDGKTVAAILAYKNKYLK